MNYNSEVKVLSKLRKLKEFAKNNPKKYVSQSVYNLICDVDLLEIAYNNIKSNPGNMTPAARPETLDGISKELLIDISKRLKSESFKFSPQRRVIIPKASGGVRPLTIASPRDKIVQEAMRIVLQTIFEPTFLDVSHGFRPNKSCHSALKYIRNHFKPAVWFIEGDISKCFDSIPQDQLLILIQAKIRDRQFTKLIAKSLKAGYFEFCYYQHDIAGTPQGSIISPILSNIFLHQLDEYLMDLKVNYDSRSKPRRTRIFRTKEYLLKKAKLTEDPSEIRKAVSNMRSTPAIDFYDPLYKRLTYVRYADD